VNRTVPISAFLVTCCVTLPASVFWAKVSRFYVEQESQIYIEITRDTQAVVALIIVIGVVRIKDGDDTFLN
jgi:hypothetical protein